MSSVVRDLMFILCISSVPDSLKGMMKGVIKALELQKWCSYINLLGHWGINLSLQMLLAFYLNMHLLGLWCAKLILEIYIFTTYFLLIYFSDWNKIAQRVHSRLLRDHKRSLIMKKDYHPGIGPSEKAIGRPKSKASDF